MKNFSIEKFEYDIICDEKPVDSALEFEIYNDSMRVYLKTRKDRPRFVTLKWSFETDGDIYVLGDAWERSYADLNFEKLSNESRPMPWYFAATDKFKTDCFGVDCFILIFAF